MKKINNTFDASKHDLRFPLYKIHPFNDEPREAYIYLDLASGDVGANVREVFFNISKREANSVLLTFPINPKAHKAEIADIIERNLPTLQVILNNSTLHTENNETIGNLNELGRSNFEALQFLESQELKIDMIDKYCLEEYLQYVVYPTPEQSVDEFAAEVLEKDGTNCAYFADDLSCKDSMLKALTALWKSLANTGNELPENVAKYLIDKDEVNLSLDELIGAA